MEYRYWLLRFANNAEALAKFVQIEYTLFKGMRKKAAKQLCTAQLNAEVAWRLGVRIAHRQMDYLEAAAAIATLHCTPAEKEPEYLFCLADAHYRNGALTTARPLLEQLILEFPVTIYTAQARVLLSRIP